MNDSKIIKLCKELGCCDVCCLRYIGLKSPAAYEDAKQFLIKVRHVFCVIFKRFSNTKDVLSFEI